jgi:hypothetical protein
MSLDDRVRAGLEANAVDFLPEFEARLARVHARLRRRRALQASTVVASVAAAVAVVAIVGSPRLLTDREEPVPQPTVTTTAPSEPRIPDSSWSRTLTEADADRAGIPPGNPLLEEFGADKRLPLTFQFQDDAFSILVTNDQGFSEVGDFGSVRYDAPGRLTATSDSPGCPACEYRLIWEIRGDRLILGSVPGADLPRVERFVMLGVWRRSS